MQIVMRTIALAGTTLLVALGPSRCAAFSPHSHGITLAA
jgi:hypothetical protein